MTKILLVGDIHVSDKAPSSATETYTDDIIDMLRWLADYGAEHKVDAVVWAGDIFHHKQPSRTSHATVLKMIEVVQYYLEKGLELRIVIGNHDISNDVLDSVNEKQPLGVLLRAGAQELNGWHPTLPVFGVPWQQRWLDPETPWEAFKEWREGIPDHASMQPGEKALAVTHAPIYPPKEAESVLFELVPTQGEHGLGEAMAHAGYLYYGHIHEDHGIFEVEGVTYCNPGALSRGSLHEYNLEREIKAALWTEDGFEIIPVPHKPASEVFKLVEAEEKKTERLSLDNFLSEVGGSTLDISSTESVVAHIKKMDVDSAVKERAIEVLEEVS